jgi:hypothetical protein
VRRRMMMVAALAAPLASIVSCTSLAGLTGGGLDAGNNEAGSPDDGVVDAPAPPADTGTEAAPPCDAGADIATDAYFCDLQGAMHTFCADFDEPNYLVSWSGSTVTEGGVLAQDPLEYTSPPFGLSAQIPMRTVGGAQSRLERLFAVPPSGVTVAFDLFVDDAGGSNVYVAVVDLQSRYVFTITLSGSNPATLGVEEQSPNGDAGYFYEGVPGVSSPIPTGAWSHVSVDFSLSGDAGNVTRLTLNDGGTLKGTPPYPPSTSPQGFKLSAGVAHYSNSPYSAWAVHIDNLTVDVR